MLTCSAAESYTVNLFASQLLRGQDPEEKLEPLGAEKITVLFEDCI
jgi:hypothetical protein